MESRVRSDGKLDGKALENLNLNEYAKKFEPRLLILSFVLGFCGKELPALGDKLPLVISIMESLYKMSSGCIMPFR